MGKEKQIGVVGGSEATEDTKRIAEAVGAGIARAGMTLVCGGLGGVMMAAARGAQNAGGFTLGLLPGTDRDLANPFIECVVATGLGEFRNYLIVRTVDVLIALPGEHGTLSEIAMALTLGKPVIGLGTWDIKGIIPAKTAELAVQKALGAIR